MNKIILIGNLTRDVEQTSTPTGISLAKFSIAVNRYNGTSPDNEPDYFNIIAWRTLGERCAQFLSKGKKVAVIGSLQIRNYEDRDGNKRTSVEVIADNVEFLSPRSEGSNGNPPVSTSSSRDSYSMSQSQKKVRDLEPVEDDGLPF